MRAGRLRHRVTIEQPTTGAFGEADSWAALDATNPERWASIEPAEGREFFTAKHDVAETPLRFRLRWDSVIDTVTEKMRITMDSGARIFDIQSVVNLDERDREVHIFATEQR